MVARLAIPAGGGTVAMSSGGRRVGERPEEIHPVEKSEEERESGPRDAGERK